MAFIHLYSGAILTGHAGSLIRCSTG